MFAAIEPAPTSLICPNGETVWLRGRVAPHTALIAHFKEVTVGGGSANASGVWEIPLIVRERAGIYPVVVRQRQDGTPVAEFTCYVDVLLGATITPTPALQMASATLPLVSPTALAAPPSPTIPRSTTGIGPTPTFVSPVTTGAIPTTSATATLFPNPSQTPNPSLELTPTPPAGLRLVTIQPDDPDEPGLFEYVILENQATLALNLSGWRLVDQETGAAYAFPAVSLSPGELLVLWSGQGTDDPAGGSLFWPTALSRWSPGTTATLFAPNSVVASTFVVPTAPPPGGS